MSSLTSLIRQNALIQKLRQSTGNTLIELQAYMQNLPQLDGSEYSERTFFRDVKTIRTAHKIDIDYDRKNKIYRITTPTDELNIKALESFEMLAALMREGNFSEFVLFSSRRPQGVQYFQQLLKAIKAYKIVKFNYQEFYEDRIDNCTVEPYALKEFKGRWYLLAKNQNDNKIEAFGLHKMSMVDTKPGKFKYPTGFDPKQLFKNCFGILLPDERDEVKKVILSFHTQQGKYVKDYPLHESQKEIIDNDEEYRISLNVYIKFDFIMEILSYGEDVEVIAPESLRIEVKKRYSQASKLYD
ncbi:MAG TPA: WYL domain-containing protein [Mucilaginibacter sp.]|jgi:predicted DNA-binding transcriptional regulator YafY|nr:WYL domain-containing protein [Mucilaginibacter sp.]